MLLPICKFTSTKLEFISFRGNFWQQIMTLLPPTPTQQKHIDKQLPPDPEMRKQDIRAIREWLSKQPHLPNHMDNGRLERFLYGCKNSVERCKLILERYFSVRTSLPEFFAVRDPLSRDIQDCCDAIDYFVLPSLSDEGYRVTVLRVRDTNPEKFSIQAIARRILMVLDIRLAEETCLSNIMIIDLQGFHAIHFAKCSPTQSNVRRAMLAVQDSMPFRLFSVHFLHAPSSITSILNIFYPLLKEKLIHKFHIHNGGGEELYAYMNKDILPNEWGGKAGTLRELNAAWRERIEKNRDWFLREEKLSRADESARLPDSKPLSLLMELEGIQGTFRKLNID
ncbi:alpha-tocopherol transfer protein-like isoform X2 [Odontomachus brunneus]|uniref:alpha-tocopherol transfer protein-like isoform X2 n=1 Tax=Odontomachus brunneus TaxID=486640 RepID=UPI0013F1EC9B|nr:alpha-tocopherol transfer protein-like isoform X2 [Odontomachus brunneus]